MIAKMLKYQFLVFHREEEKFLDLLKDLGVVHVKSVSREMHPESKKLLRRKSSIKQERRLFERKVAKLKDVDADNLSSTSFQIEQIGRYLQDHNELTKQSTRLQEELYHVRYFGKYDPEMIRELEDKGLYFHLFSTGKGKIREEWTQKYAFEVLFETGRKSWFLIVSDNESPPKIKAQAESFPDRSAVELEEALKNTRQYIRDLENWFLTNENAILDYLTQEEHQIDDKIQDLYAEDQIMPMGFGKVLFLSGWVPSKLSKDLESTLDEAGYYFRKERPTPRDNPPILLKNRALGKWFEPITELFAFPSYTELDLTPFFAPFFLLFFGFCLGDGGYGLFLFIILLLIRPKVPKKYLGLWKLALALELVAFFMGVLAGTFFGINLFETDVPILVNFRDYMLDANGLFTFALILGGVQILFGLILRMINRVKQFGWQYMISPLGWILLLCSLTVGYIQGFTTLWTVTAWAGVAMIIIWSDPEKKIAIRIGMGLWELYGISGFFGDLLSYIRLFALGLAGSILGYVVNDIAFTIFETHKFFGPVFGVIMLLVGHGLNIFIATLGAFVHPMRLTFVEFYKNAGFTGGGEAYNPLRKLHPKSKES